MAVLVISCSLNPSSRSNVLAHAAVHELEVLGQQTGLIDLRQTPLPQCDGADAYSNPSAKALKSAVSESTAVLMAVPVYNYSAGSAAKNVVELAGDGFSGKIVGFLCAAGGKGSYMSVMGLANSLMLDFRCLIVPRFVYATKDQFVDGEGEGGDVVPPVRKRIAELCRITVRLTEAMQQTV